MSPQRENGLVIRVTGHEIWVNVGDATLRCVLRGRFRQSESNFQVVAGDRVEVSREHGTIEAVHPRKTWLSRYVGGRASTERVIVANIDRLILVVSLRAPRLSLGFIDRVLVSAERGHAPATICINKIDTVKAKDNIDEIESLYTRVGYPVIRASAETGEGVADVAAFLEGGIYAFVGQSGVGKSSILNRIDPGLGLKIGRVAAKTGRGRHTTTFSQLYAIEGGYMADTPGMQTFGFPGTDKRELVDCFPEFGEYTVGCRFQGCTHTHEPDCRVKDALESGAVAASRYQSYEQMLVEIEQREKGRY